MKQAKHVGVYGVVLQNYRIVLIQKKRGPYTGLLDLPGGSTEHGEEILETLKREFMEEANLEITQAELFNNFACTVESEENGEHVSLHHLGMIYMVRQFEDKGMGSSGDDQDSGGAAWYDLDSLTKKQLSPFAYRVISVLKQ